MNRTSMARQIEDPPMKTAKKMARGGKVKMARGGKVMMARGGKVKGKDDQSMVSPRKAMAMGMKRG
jgi:hypothetical protein